MPDSAYKHLLELRRQRSLLERNIRISTNQNQLPMISLQIDPTSPNCAILQ